MPDHLYNELFLGIGSSARFIIAEGILTKDGGGIKLREIGLGEGTTTRLASVA